MSAMAFASCGDKGADAQKDSETSKSVGGTQEYKDITKAFDEYEETLGKAKDCDDLKSANLKIDYNKEYGSKEKITPEEEDKLIIRQAELQVKSRKLCRQYQCDWCKNDWKKD